jgi:multidrug efflux pump subunit AcrB
VSLFMSLIVAMTVTPLLCRLMLSGDKYLSKNEKDRRPVCLGTKHPFGAYDLILIIV